jgi:hypothetical protein
MPHTQSEPPFLHAHTAASFLPSAMELRPDHESFVHECTAMPILSTIPRGCASHGRRKAMKSILGLTLFILLASHGVAMAANTFDLLAVKRKIEHKETDTVTFAVTGEIDNHGKRPLTSLSIKAIDKNYQELGRISLNGKVEAGQQGELTGQGTMSLEQYRQIRGWRILE